jgi:hypothetical protein
VSSTIEILSPQFGHAKKCSIASRISHSQRRATAIRLDPS